jgi:ABC-type glycerol-3-phosphate transport system substrate-binding protein
MIALQQDTASMGLQWTSRAAAMDIENQSRVVGKMDWVPAPSGGARFTTEAYAISAFSKQDPELLFRILATATNRAGIDGIAGKIVPPRTSSLNDPTLKDKSRFVAAAAQAVASSKPYPQLPEFSAVGGLIARRIVQAVAGEMPVKAALDAAAGETKVYLAERGYYK